jgi:SAM-dependent methyltransferase
MTNTTRDEPREAEVVARATETAAGWLPLADSIERMLEPIHDILLPAAALRPGENVIDVGCGTGTTAAAAARVVGQAGKVTAIDAARNAIQTAGRRNIPPGSAWLYWVVGDGQRFEFEPEAADAVISRLGVMFFDDLTAALANLLLATRPGGRFAAVVWLPKDRSPLHSRPLAVAAEAAAQLGWAIDVGAPDAGPFGFATDATLQAMEDAGWRDARLEPHHVWLYAGGPGTTPEAVARDVFVGPALGEQLKDAPRDVTRAVERAVARDLEQCWDGAGVRLDAMVATLTAHRPLPH